MHYAESGIKTADTLLKSATGYVKSITIAFKGVTAGELVNLKDGLDVAAATEVVFIYPAANGTLEKVWSGEGKRFDTGIFLNIGATAGSVYVEMTYK